MKSNVKKNFFTNIFQIRFFFVLFFLLSSFSLIIKIILAQEPFTVYTKQASVTQGSNGGGAAIFVCKNNNVVNATVDPNPDGYVTSCVCVSCPKPESSCSYVSGYGGKGGCRVYSPGTDYSGATSTTTCSITCTKYNTTSSTPTPTGNTTLTPTPTGSTNCSLKNKGDANCDGKIDGIDYSYWLNRQCTTGCQTENLKADFNSDGKVNDDDYSVWFNNRT